VYILIYKIR